MIDNWDELAFWQSKDWETIQERLDALERKHIQYNPRRDLLFAALDACPFSRVRVLILGQDPYPNHDMATGLAFSVPKTTKKLPPTLQNILKEYQNDLWLPNPGHGDLSVWSSGGVLLWNVIPTCEENSPGSHRSWYEWDSLTKEIVQTCSDKGIVFGLLGAFARAYKDFIDEEGNSIVETAHPSPLASKAEHPFLGSRFFSTINQKLCEMKLEPIEWRIQ